MSSDTKAAAAVVTAACIPHDVMSNILERVPDLVSLFRCSLVCKEWCGLVSDPAFLRRRGIGPEPEGGQSPSPQSSASLIGIIVQRDRPLRANSRPRKISKRFPTLAPAFVPAPGSVLGPQLRFLTSFVRDDDGILDDATPLAARDGLLLVRIWRPSDSSSVVVLRLCVCNLLTGRRDLLPALDADEAFTADRVLGYALLTAADGPADGLFRVLLVGRGQREQLQLRRFSSASGGDWDALDCRQPNLMLRAWDRHRPKGLLLEPYCRVATVARGSAHWLFRGSYILNVSAAGTAGRVSMTALHMDVEDTIVGLYNPWLCTTAKGSLAVLSLKKNRLAMMKQQDDDVDHWDSGHVTEVGLDVELGFGHEWLSLAFVGDRSGTALALYSGSEPERAYVLDLQSGSASRVEGWIQCFNYMTAVPFEINWALFFMSRLGVKLRDASCVQPTPGTAVNSDMILSRIGGGEPDS